MNPLTPQEYDIIIKKATEAPFSGVYNDFYQEGIYVCKQCGAELYTSSAKFKSGCGWPSFDACISEAIEYQLDADKRRTEILCKQCGGHLGHVFVGEGYTPKNTRHCVNSLSLHFIPKK
ncbi:peptide-methionine (R)-S-oxide reductase [Helicobacter sp. 12S02634-8]|uniref:methionine-R-sulfoxide reductase n=1 Tax=Helicobacter sp. 12S02634-8 TaxID=1476199 RepID=UPI000BA75317|nr:methionine-R-sulfoxide reductase [Helicobacter sp. 12S02634-8]PAF47273.1 peptide-methionine (R)-S-oxide reductase [Helicobacter sp. 12S02634-8]